MLNLISRMKKSHPVTNICLFIIAARFLYILTLIISIPIFLSFILSVLLHFWKIAQQLIIIVDSSITKPRSHNSNNSNNYRTAVKTSPSNDPGNSNSSPPRPSTLPVAAQPIPAPQRNVRVRRDSEKEKRESEQSYNATVSVDGNSVLLNKFFAVKSQTQNLT